MNTPTDTPETDAFEAAHATSRNVARYYAALKAMRHLERRARAALRLRPIAEAGPVPEGAVRLWAYWLEGFQCWSFKDIPVNDPTHFIDIYPPQP